eukprot:gb/GECH01010942.1/.p1 GENE.gb/GECH01010942.1/~~gb/GECH01010942.1/.p1  ORF type:complete len:408 (+),score=37.20 gb/GECH01010942.1/:1-1224(+)
MRAIRIHSIFNPLCFDHILNRCLNDMFTQQHVLTLFRKCKAVAKHFRQSSKSRKMLQSFSEEEYFEDEEKKASKNIKGYCKTRWLSASEMVHSILYNLRGIDHVIRKRIQEGEISEIVPFNRKEKISLYFLDTVLLELRRVMLLMEEENSSTFSEFFPLFHGIADVIEKSINYARREPLDEEEDAFIGYSPPDFHAEKTKLNQIINQHDTPPNILAMDETIKESLKCFLSGLKNRMKLDHPSFQVALLLNPKHRNLNFLASSMQKEEIQEYRMKLYNLFQSVFLSWKRDQDINHEPPNKKRRTSVFDNSEKTESDYSFQDRELQTYFDLPPIDKESFQSVINWWYEHKNTLPNLSEFAKGYLVTSATSGSIERAWSFGKDTVDDKRQLLDSDSISHLLFLKYNQNGL